MNFFKIDSSYFILKKQTKIKYQIFIDLKAPMIKDFPFIFKKKMKELLLKKIIRAFIFKYFIMQLMYELKMSNKMFSDAIQEFVAYYFYLITITL